jgi:hypothetical protein
VSNEGFGIHNFRTTEIIDKYRLHYNVGGITGTYGYIRIYRKE